MKPTATALFYIAASLAAGHLLYLAISPDEPQPEPIREACLLANGKTMGLDRHGASALHCITTVQPATQ